MPPAIISGASTATNVRLEQPPQPPSAPTIGSFSTDSGSVGDNITNDNTLTLTGTAAANSTVKVFDGATQIGTTRQPIAVGVGATRRPLCRMALTVSRQGPQTRLGNTSVPSATLSVTVDTVAPAAPVMLGDTISSTDQVTLTGTAEGNSTVKVFEGTTLLGTVKASGTGAWNFTTASLSPGAHDFTATATDAAGNTSAISASLDPVIGSATPTVPTLSGWPSAANTGVPAGVTLLPSGGMIINTPGAVISGLNISGTVYINAPNVTLMNCRITSGEFYVVKVNAGITGAVVQDCEINGTGLTTGGSDGIGGQGTFLRNNIYNVGNGVVIQGNNSLVQDNYIHDLNAPGEHYDGIQIDGGISNATIRHNTIINDHDQTSAVQINNWFGPVSNIVIDNNKLSGGGYTIYSDGQFNGGAISGISITNNILGKGQWGYSYFVNNTPVWQGNVDSTSSQIVNASSTISMDGPHINAFSSDTGVVGDGITNDSTVTLTGTAAVFSTVKVYDGGTLIGSTTADSTNKWSFTTSALQNGSHTLTVTATNTTPTAPSPPLTVTVDTIAPNAPVIVGNTTNSGHVTLNGTAEANSKVQVFDGSTSLGTATTSSSGTWTFTTVALSDWQQP